MPEWPPISEPELLRRLALDDAGFAEFIGGLVAELPARECDEAAIARAIAYPWARPLGSYLLGDDGVGGARGDGSRSGARQSSIASPAPRGRLPVLAIGSNAAPEALERKLAHFERRRGPHRPRPDRPPARLRHRRRRPADDVRLAAGDPLPQPRHRGPRHHPLGHPRPVHPARLVGDHLPPRPPPHPLRGRRDRRRLRRGARLRLPLRRLLPGRGAGRPGRDPGQRAHRPRAEPGAAARPRRGARARPRGERRGPDPGDLRAPGRDRRPDRRHRAPGGAAVQLGRWTPFGIARKAPGRSTTADEIPISS